MDALANLADDHVNIARALDAIDSLIVLAAGGELELPRYERAVDFIERYADGAHYEKEGYLFDEVSRVGMPRDFGPIAFLEAEHDATRAQTVRMRGALAGIQAGHPGERFVLVDALARYVAIVRVHMPKEDTCCFPIARVALSPAVKERLAERFAAIDGALPTTFAEAVAALTVRPEARDASPQPETQRFADAPLDQLARSLRSVELNPPGPCRKLGIVRRR